MKSVTNPTLSKLEKRRKAIALLKPRAPTPRDPEAILASGKIPLTEQQLKFVKAIVSGLGPGQAARVAGYAQHNNVGYQLIKNPVVQAGIMQHRRKFEAEAQMSRKKVLDGLTEAAQMAKIQGDPTGMVMAWREIGKMCGYYEAIKHKVEVSVSGQVTHQAIRAMSDEELLRLAEEGEATGRLLEGEAVQVDGEAAEDHRP